MNPNFRTPITPSRAATTPDYFLPVRGGEREKREMKGGMGRRNTDDEYFYINFPRPVFAVKLKSRA